MGKFIQDFKEFAVRGNVIDMAVGLIIGAAFGKIVSSLVEDVIMPPIALLTGAGNVEEIKWVLRDAIIEGGEVVQPEVVMNIGGFLQTVIDFIIIAFVIFLMIKGIMKLKRQKVEEPAPEAPAPPSEEVKLLSDIKELLQKQTNS